MGGSLNALRLVWIITRNSPVQNQKVDLLPFLQSRVVSIVTQYLTPFVVTLTTTSWGVLIFCMTTNSCSPKTSLVLSFEFKVCLIKREPSSSSARESIFCEGVSLSSSSIGLLASRPEKLSRRRRRCSCS